MIDLTMLAEVGKNPSIHVDPYLFYASRADHSHHDLLHLRPHLILPVASYPLHGIVNETIICYEHSLFFKIYMFFGRRKSERVFGEGRVWWV